MSDEGVPLSQGNYDYQQGGTPDGRPMMNAVGIYNADIGTKHGPVPLGQQQAAAWAVGKDDRKPLVTAEPAAALWRVSIFGDVLIDVTWGTVSTFNISGALAPMVATFPGRVSVTAVPRDSSTPTRAMCTLTPASSGQLPVFKALQTTAGPFPDFTWRVTAIDDVILDIFGTAVALAAGESFPVCDGCELTSGQIFTEFAP